jgi:predicted nicotinamide N-methyase
MSLRESERHRVQSYKVDTTTIRIGASDYRIRSLSDRSQFSDPAGEAERAGISSAAWPLFGLVWPAGIALAHAMSTLILGGRSILEVGCGLALSSLVLKRRLADITASDHHPLAEEFLRHNTDLNDLPAIAYRQAPWAGPNPDLGRYDLIIGSDVLYDRALPALLSAFLARHAKPAAQIIVADPGRSRRGEFTARMVAQGYLRSEPWGRFAGAAGPSLRGRILSFVRGPV